LRIGIDIGSTAAKAAAFEGDELICTLIVPTGFNGVDAAMRLIEANWPHDAPVRAIAVTAIRLSREEGACDQTSLLGTGGKQHERFDHAEMAMQKLRRKYGRSCITMGFVEDESMGIRQFEKKMEKDAQS